MPPYAYWDTKADRDLLLAIIDEGALKSVHWPKVAQKMSEKGYTFTHEGCRQHLAKLRKEAARSTSAPAPASTSVTPRKRSAGKSASKSAGTASALSSFIMNKSGSYSQNTSFTDDDEDAFDTPSKKVKTEKGVKKEGGVKKDGGVKKEADLEAGRAYGFKAEENGDVIDVERDDLYEADEA